MSEGLDEVRKAVVNGADEVIRYAKKYNEGAAIVNEGLEQVAAGIVRVMQGRQIAGVDIESIGGAYADVSEALRGTQREDIKTTLNGLFAALQVMTSQQEVLGGIDPLLALVQKGSDMGEAPDVMRITGEQVDLIGNQLRTYGLTM